MSGDAEVNVNLLKLTSIHFMHPNRELPNSPMGQPGPWSPFEHEVPTTITKVRVKHTVPGEGMIEEEYNHSVQCLFFRTSRFEGGNDSASQGKAMFYTEGEERCLVKDLVWQAERVVSIYEVDEITRCVILPYDYRNLREVSLFYRLELL